MAMVRHTLALDRPNPLEHGQHLPTVAASVVLEERSQLVETGSGLSMVSATVGAVVGLKLHSVAADLCALR